MGHKTARELIVIVKYLAYKIIIRWIARKPVGQLVAFLHSRSV